MSDDILSELSRRIFSQPKAFFGKPWGGPLLITVDEYERATTALLNMDGPYAKLSLMGEASDGTVGPLFRGVVLAVDYPPSQ